MTQTTHQIPLKRDTTQLLTEMSAQHASNGSRQIDGRHLCYLATKQAKLQQYAVSLSQTHLNITSIKRDKLKSAIALSTLHAKEQPKVPRQPDSEEQDTASDSSNSPKASANTLQLRTWWYPLKLVLPNNKSRTVFSESRSERKQLLSAVLAAQGFRNQLEQYDVEETIGEGSCNPVWVGRHKTNGLRVAIKAMESEKYQRLRRENQVSEGDAMFAVQSSPFILNFVEEFHLGEKTYIVTKFARGGDLLAYLGSQGVNRLSESRAKKMVHQIAQGVRDIHAKGIVHRDLKHLNIFLSDSSESPKIKIGDFGLAC
jgi:hypothetical protein